MTDDVLLIEGGGSGTWMGRITGNDSAWERVRPLDSWVRTVGVDFAAPLDQLLEDRHTKDVRLVVAAMSVVQTEADAVHWSRAIHTRVPSAQTVFACNDVVPLLGWNDRSTVVAVVGTGTGYAGRNASTNNLVRASAREWILSDEGGGFDIGMNGLRAAVRSSDGRGPQTDLLHEAIQHGGGSLEGLRDRIYGRGPVGIKQRVADFAPAVLRSSGDAVAHRILQKAASDVIAGIFACADHVDRPVDLVLEGSIVCSSTSSTMKEIILNAAANHFGEIHILCDGRDRVLSLSQQIEQTQVDRLIMSATGERLPAHCIRNV